jgi:hypothetical protein
MSKIRLVGGPFGGTTKNVNVAGKDEIIFSGPRKMTRRKRYEHAMANYNANAAAFNHVPMTEARYRLAMRPHHNGHNVIMAPCQHPDGSLFYEYVENSRRDY